MASFLYSSGKLVLFKKVIPIGVEWEVNVRSGDFVEAQKSFGPKKFGSGI